MNVRFLVLGLVAVVVAVLGIGGSKPVGREVLRSDTDDLAGSWSGSGDGLGLVRQTIEQQPPEGVLVVGELYQLASPHVEEGPFIDVEGKVPGSVVECPSTGKPIRVPSGVGVQAVAQMVTTTNVPRVAFTDATLTEAFDCLGEHCGNKISFVFDDRFLDSYQPDDERLTFDLANRTLLETVRYLGAVAGCNFRIEAGQILFYPMLDTTEQVLTEFIKVKETFPSVVIPILDEDHMVPERSPVMLNRRSARDILCEGGIVFEDGASAVFLPDSCTLVVTNRRHQIQLVERLASSDFQLVEEDESEDPFAE